MILSALRMFVQMIEVFSGDENEEERATRRRSSVVGVAVASLVMKDVDGGGAAGAGGGLGDTPEYTTNPLIGTEPEEYGQADDVGLALDDWYQSPGAAV